MINEALLKIILKEGAYILLVVVLPLIVIGFLILKNRKKQEIIIAIILVIALYGFCARSLVDSASNIVSAISTSNTNTNEPGTDITYLKNYADKMNRNGYLSKYDVTQIIKLSDAKSKEIFINYKDESSNIDIKISNKEDDKIQELEQSLKYDYYTFNYNISENNEITINIERYIIETNTKKEKNDFILTGTKNTEIIENTYKYIGDSNFIFENEIKLNEQTEEKQLQGFKMLLVYDNENFIPVTDNKEEYNLIKSYKVYSSGIDIILQDGVDLINEDYTLRINRYDDNLEVTNGYYYYEYEPVVTQGIYSGGNILLEIKFPQTYTIEELKNIEIIFGSNN